MFALATLVFAACSDDHAISDGNSDVVTDPSGDAWVALNIKTPAAVTRGLNIPNQENAITGEYEIEDVKAIFFDGDQDASLVTKVIDLNTGSGDLTSSGASSNSKAFQIPATSKTILIIANPGSGFSSVGEGSSFVDVNKAVKDESITTSVAKTGTFLMTNSKGHLEPSDNSGNTINLTLYKSQDVAVKNPLAIYIDRVVAKVRVYTSDGAMDNSTASIYSPKWILNVTNKWYYPVSRRIKTWNEDPANTPDARGTCVTPFDRYEIGSYRVDPNYNNTNIGEWNEANQVAYTNNYNFVSASTNASAISWNEISSASNPVTEYCLENTQEKEYNIHAYTTQVLLQANFAPKKLKKLDGGTVDVGEGESWMIVNGVSYTYDTLMDWIENELTKKYKDGNPDGYPASISTAFNRYVKYVDSSKEVTIPTGDEFKQSGQSAETQAAALKQKFVDARLAVENKGAGSYGTVFYYDGGVSYYKIMIKHDDSDKAMNEFGEFGVVRNSVYDINIKGFNNPGYPTIPDPDPDMPDENDETWLSIQINVNPWTWYSQEEIL